MIFNCPVSVLQLKLRSQITTEQEKLLGDKNREMEEMRKDLESTKTNLREKTGEVSYRHVWRTARWVHLVLTNTWTHI